MTARMLRAVGLAVRLAHLLRSPDAEPFLTATIQTPGGELRWQLELSEATVERLTRLLEAEEIRQSAIHSGLRLVR